MLRNRIQWALFFSLIGSLLATQTTHAAELPSPDQLPKNEQMPDPLVMFDGSKVATADDWSTKRKPELKKLLQHYMYGYLPEAPTVTGIVTSEHTDALGGKATLKQITLSFGSAECPKIELLLVVPNKPSNSRPPIVLGLNFTGNHSVMSDPRVELPKTWMRDEPDVINHRATEAGRGKASDRWEIEHAIDRGYAVATFYYGDVSPDKPGLEEGVHACIRTGDQSDPTNTGWGAIAAWAWGLHRAVDYLTTDGDVDPKRIVVFGHSRNGKAALLAGAFDERIAATIAHQAGCGGSAPSRRQNPKGEPVATINKNFPHWFDGNFKKFSGHEDQLPFDQHCLVALCAPRPVLFTNGDQDQWADPAGQLEVLLAANPVYHLMKVDGMPEEAQAENGKRIGDRLCYYVREAPHTVDRVYWDVFLDFADEQLPNPEK